MEFKKLVVLDKTKPLATDIALVFEDTDINKEDYEFLNSKLEDYNLEIDPELKMTQDTGYDEYSKKFLIGVIITIPDRLVPKDIEESSKMMANHIIRFAGFYENLKLRSTQLNN